MKGCMNLRFRLTAVLIFVACGCITSQAQAGTYNVKDCRPIPAGDAVPLVQFSTNSAGKWYNDLGLWSGGTYPCVQVDGSGFDVLPLYARGSNMSNGDVARLKWSVDNGLGIKRVQAQYWVSVINPTNPEFLPRFLMHNSGSNGLVLPIGQNTLGFVDYVVPNNQVRTDFELNLKCIKSNCVGGTYLDFIMAGNLSFTVVDPNAPYVGHTTNPSDPYDLYGPGPVSGIRRVAGYAVDTGSGVFLNWLLVNNHVLALDVESSENPAVSCNPSTPTHNTFTPCPIISEISWFMDTAKSPFVNGSNQVRICTQDYSGEHSCESPVTVHVSN